MELIVVIAIIGVLAAVLIPTFSGAIESARVADDQAQLRNMNTELTMSTIMGDKELDMHGAYQILVRNGEYTLAAKSANHTFWWDRAAKQLVLANTQEILSNANYDGAASAAEYERDDIGAVAANPRYVLVDQGTSELAQAVNGLRGIGSSNQTYAEKAQSIQTYADTLADIVNSSVNVQDMASTMMFWGESGNYVPNTVKAISFELGVRVLPAAPSLSNINSLFDTESEDRTIVLPSTVGLVQAGAFSQLFSATFNISAPTSTVFASGSLPESITITINGQNGNSLEQDLIQTSLEYTQNFNQMEVYYWEGEELKRKKILFEDKNGDGIVNSLDVDYSNISYVTGNEKFAYAFMVFNFAYYNNGQGAELIFTRTTNGSLVTYSGIVYKADGSLYGTAQNVGYFTAIEVSDDEKTITLPFTEDQLTNYAGKEVEGEAETWKLSAKAGNLTAKVDTNTDGKFTLTFETAPTSGTYQIFYDGNLIFEQAI